MFHILLAGVVWVFVWWLWNDTQRPRGSAPGPPYWPIFGNLLQMMWKTRGGKPQHMIMEDIIEKYGDVIQMRLMHNKVVVISGKETIKEVMFRDEFNGRPSNFIFLYRSGGKKMGIVLNEGHEWSEQRRFILRILRNFGFGKMTMETAIKDETSALVDSIRENLSKPLQVDTMFSVPVINILWAIVAGKRFPLGDKKLATLFDLIYRQLKSIDPSGGMLGVFPWLRHIMPDYSGFTVIKKTTEELNAFINEIIDEHQKTLNVDEPRDVIDAYFIEMSKYEGQQTSFTREQLLMVCSDFFQAGSETTSNSLAFFLLYMILYPEVQKKVQEEIDTVIGRERQANLQDRINMPYTEATIMETTRLSPILPMLIAHKATTTTQLKNYTIEKDTILLISAYNLHVDLYWKDPLKFRPERFIGENGKVIQDENLLLFGMGKRRCTGETLARANLFLFPVALLQKFDVKNPKNEPMPLVKNIDGFTQSPKPFRAVFTLRAE